MKISAHGRLRAARTPGRDHSGTMSSTASIVQRLGKLSVKFLQPNGHFLWGSGRPDAVVFARDELHQRTRIMYFDASKRIIEQRVKVEFERSGSGIRLQPDSLNFVKPTSQLCSKVMSQLRIKLERDKLDEMFVYRICNTNDDVSRQLLRIRHLQCFVDFHLDLTSGRPRDRPSPSDRDRDR